MGLIRWWRERKHFDELTPDDDFAVSYGDPDRDPDENTDMADFLKMAAASGPEAALEAQAARHRREKEKAQERRANHQYQWTKIGTVAAIVAALSGSVAAIAAVCSGS